MHMTIIPSMIVFLRPRRSEGRQSILAKCSVTGAELLPPIAMVQIAPRRQPSSYTATVMPAMSGSRHSGKTWKGEMSSLRRNAHAERTLAHLEKALERDETTHDALVISGLLRDQLPSVRSAANPSFLTQKERIRIPRPSMPARSDCAVRLIGAQLHIQPRKRAPASTHRFPVASLKKRCGTRHMFASTTDLEIVESGSSS